MDSELMASFGTWGPIVLMVLIFYFLLIRPQKKAQKKRQSMLDALKRGTRIITIGGIYGTIIALDDTTVRVEISKGVIIDMTRSSIASIAPEAKKEASSDGDDAADE